MAGLRAAGQNIVVQTFRFHVMAKAIVQVFAQFQGSQLAVLVEIREALQRLFEEHRQIAPSAKLGSNLRGDVFFRGEQTHATGA